MNNYCNLHFISYIALFCFLLGGIKSIMSPMRSQNYGIFYGHKYKKFTLINSLSQKQIQQKSKEEKTQILTQILKRLPKVERTIQLVGVSGQINGLFELILLTQQNNFDNRLIIVKQKPYQHIWMNKNLHLNGLQQQASLYYANVKSYCKLENIQYCNKFYHYQYEGKVNNTLYFDQLLEPKSRCQQCLQQYKISTTIEYILQRQQSIRKTKINNQYQYLQLIFNIQSISQAIAMRKSINNLITKFKSQSLNNSKDTSLSHKGANIQMFVIVEYPLPIHVLLPMHDLSGDKVGVIVQQNKKKGNVVKFQRFLKYSIQKIQIINTEKKTSLQFTPVQYQLSDLTNVKQSQNRKYKYPILKEGVYYIYMGQKDRLFGV